MGHWTFGSAYREQIVDQLRRAAEHCDCLQCFFLIHSMGGGEDSSVQMYTWSHNYWNTLLLHERRSSFFSVMFWITMMCRVLCCDGQGLDQAWAPVCWNFWRRSSPRYVVSSPQSTPQQRTMSSLPPTTVSWPCGSSPSMPTVSSLWRIRCVCVRARYFRIMHDHVLQSVTDCCK